MPTVTLAELIFHLLGHLLHVCEWERENGKRDRQRKKRREREKRIN